MQSTIGKANFSALVAHPAPHTKSRLVFRLLLALGLDLETARASSATSTLELATLGDNMRLLALVGAKAKVLNSLAAVLGATQDQSVAASGGAEGKLVKSDGLTTGSHNAGAGGSGEAESGDGHLGDGEQAVVISDGADNNDSALLALLVDVGNDPGQRDRGSVDLGHKKAPKNNLVEGRVGTTGKKAVELYQELKIDIVALGRLAVR